MAMADKGSRRTLGQVVRGIPGKLRCKFVGERNVILLQRALVRRLGIGQRDKAIGFPRRGEAVVVCEHTGSVRRKQPRNAKEGNAPTAEISAPTASGNEDFTCCSLSE